MPNTSNPQIVATHNTNQHFIELCRELDNYLDEIVGGRANRAQYLPYNNAEDVSDVFLVYVNGKAAGCAALKLYDETTGEIKRVFVKGEYRGQGLSLMLMRALEAKARKLGLRGIDFGNGRSPKGSYGLIHKTGICGYNLLRTIYRYAGFHLHAQRT